MKANVVIFSSGESERNGNVLKVKNELAKYCNCYDWRELFVNAKQSNSIALLPLLIKKIPSFDFAIIICEGHDKTDLVRNGKSENVMTMRDNVLFEIGLSSMSLGITRVILLTDKNVRLPEDLTGVNGEIASKRIEFENDISAVFGHLSDYIRETISDYFPVVVGAAASTAVGYVQNFIMRFYENYRGKIVSNGTELSFPIEKVFIKVYIPEEYCKNDYDNSIQNVRLLQKGYIDDNSVRLCSFSFYQEDDKLIIVDFPTTLRTSYSTAKLILNIQADDSYDTEAEKRYLRKEFMLFANTIDFLLQKSNLKKLCSNATSEVVDVVNKNVSEERKYF